MAVQGPTTDRTATAAVEGVDRRSAGCRIGGEQVDEIGGAGVVAQHHGRDLIVEASQDAQQVLGARAVQRRVRTGAPRQPSTSRIPSSVSLVGAVPQYMTRSAQPEAADVLVEPGQRVLAAVRERPVVIREAMDRPSPRFGVADDARRACAWCLRLAHGLSPRSSSRRGVSGRQVAMGLLVMVGCWSR